MSKNYDLLVIGAGPGGYVASIRAAQLGLRVACVDKEDALGGACLRVGCIPSKVLLESTELFEKTKSEFAVHGIQVRAKVDLAKMMARKDTIVSQFTRGIEGLFKKNKVERIRGAAVITGAKTLKVNGKTLGGKAILIATGAAPASLPGITIDNKKIVDSTGALAFRKVPKSLIVIGAGAIGLELGSVWARLGAAVVVLEFLPRILPGADGEAAKLAARILGRRGLKIETGVRVTGAKTTKDGVVVTGDGKKAGDPPRKWKAEKLLVAVGRKPCTEGLGLESVGIELDERGFIPVNEKFETGAAGIYAVGDIIAGPMLAHKASEEGVAMVETLVGKAGHVSYEAIPSIVYTDPEIASVGKSEEELTAAGVKYRKGSFPFAANGRARSLNAKEGFTKILSDAATDRILGVHIVGPRAGEIIAEAVLAMEFQASGEDLARSVHAHPSLSETLKEAALALSGKAIHV